jgi:hypothetical protein
MGELFAGKYMGNLTLVSTGRWSLVTGYWLLVTGYWLLVTGYWSLVTRLREALRRASWLLPTGSNGNL